MNRTALGALRVRSTQRRVSVFAEQRAHQGTLRPNFRIEGRVGRTHNADHEPEPIAEHERVANFQPLPVAGRGELFSRAITAQLAGGALAEHRFDRCWNIVVRLAVRLHAAHACLAEPLAAGEKRNVMDTGSHRGIVQATYLQEPPVGAARGWIRARLTDYHVRLTAGQRAVGLFVTQHGRLDLDVGQIAHIEIAEDLVGGAIGDD